MLNAKSLTCLCALLTLVGACQSANDGAPAAAGGTGGATGADPYGGPTGEWTAGSGGSSHSAGKGGAKNGPGAGQGGSSAGAASSAGMGGSSGGESTQGGSAGSSGAGSAGSAGGSGAGDGEAGQGGAAGSAGDGSRVFAYVSAYLGGLRTFSIDSVTGRPRVLSGSAARLGDHLLALAKDPGQRFLYTADSDGKRIDSYRIADDGRLPAKPSSSVNTSGQPVTLTIEPSGHFAYVGSTDDKSLAAFAIDADTGALTAQESPLTLAGAPNYVVADPSGHFLYVTQAFERGIRGYRIGQQKGALTELSGSPFGKDLVLAGALMCHPSGAFLFSSGGGVNAFKVDPESGKLSPVLGSPFSLDVASDPYATNLALDPAGKFLYATHFLPDQHVLGFSIADNGALSPVPGSPLHTSTPYSVAVDPSGRFLFVGNDVNEIAVFKTTLGTGALHEIEGSPFEPGGLQPAIVFVDLSGR